MANWFDVTLKYEGMGDNGAPREMKTKLLVEAECCMDAEVSAIKWLDGRGTTVEAVTKKKYESVDALQGSATSILYKAKMGIAELDEKTGEEKRKFHEIIVGACDFADAYGMVKEMYSMLTNWSIYALTETNYADVIKLEDDGERI